MIYKHPDGTPEYITDVLLDEITEETEEFIATHGEKAGDTFYKIAKGQGVLLSTQIDPWLGRNKLTQQTKRRRSIGLFCGRLLLGREMTYSSKT